MALSHSPKIVTNGLVFYYDMSNTKKSNIGDTTTNLISNGDFFDGKTGWSNYVAASSSVVTVYDFPTALRSPKTVLQYDSPGTIGGGGNYGGFSRSAPALTSGTTYTISFTARSLSGNMTFAFSHQNGSGDNSNLSFNSTITSNWRRYTRTVSLDLVKNTIYFWNQNVSSGTFQISDIQLEAKSTATTFTSTTRSATQSVLDLTGRTTVTVSSLNYASDGTFSFNGISDYINLGTSIQLSDNLSLSVWHKNPNTGFIIDQGNIDTDPTGCLEWTNYGLSLGSNNLSGVIDSTTVSSLNTAIWNNVVCTFNNGQVNFYLNGNLTSTTTTSFTSFLPQGQILKIGRRAFNTSSIFSGIIGAVQIYNNKVLTAAEVQQNFNALRGRYGI